MLFLTRDARCSRSIDDRRVGDGDVSLPANRFSELNRLGVAGSRPCQKSRGDALPSGDDWNGDESVLRIIFCVVKLALKSPAAQVTDELSYLGGLVVTGRVPPLLSGRKLRERPR